MYEDNEEEQDSPLTLDAEEAGDIRKKGRALQLVNQNI